MKRSLLIASMGLLVMASGASARSVALGTGARLPASPPVPAWTGPNRLFNGSFGAVSMSVDSHGKVHAAVEQGAGYIPSIYYITNRTGSWKKHLVAKSQADGNAWQEPVLTLDDNDRVYIAADRWDTQVADCDCTDGYFLFTDKGRARGTFPHNGTRLTVSNARDLSLKSHANHLYLAYRTGWMYSLESPDHTDGQVWFKTNATGSWTRVRVARHLNAQVPTPSLRVGSNGKARIAYDNSGIFVATASTLKGGFSIQKIPGTTVGDSDPSLALDNADRPHAAYRQNLAGTANDGTVLADRGPSTWTTDRFTSRRGTTALSLDGTDEPHVIVGKPNGAGGLYSYVGPGLSEDVVASVRVSSLSFRVASAGGPVLMYTTPTAPKGVYLTRD